jgi:hypothetical protein
MDFVMCLLHARTTAHLKHWMTPSRSDHQALQFFYEAAPDLIDSFVEGFQGEYGKITNVPDGYMFPKGPPYPYFDSLGIEIDKYRSSPAFPQETWLQNVVDEIRLLVSQTKYQLKELD